MPTIVKGLKRKQIVLEGNDGSGPKELGIYYVTDERGKLYKVGPGLFMVDFFTIDTTRIIAAEPNGPVGRPDGFKLTMQDIPNPLYFRERDYDISLIQDLFIISRNLLATGNPNQNGQV